MPTTKRKKRKQTGAAGDIEQLIRFLVENPWGEFVSFGRELTPAENACFQRLYPAEFFHKWGFETDDQSTGFGCAFEAVFHRTNFLEFAGKRKLTPFEPPIIQSPRHIEGHKLARARGEWWRKNRLPMTEAEREFLAGDPIQQFSGLEADFAERKRRWDRGKAGPTAEVIPITL